tara:strand:+ start:74 stop:334 length:261 start_codon:yes stop_codon:yes gene_type:complete
MEALGTILMVAGGIGGLITSIILLIAAFKDNIWWGLGSLFCGIPLLVFCIMNFEEVKKPFLIYIGCIIAYVIGLGMASASLFGGMP